MANTYTSLYYHIVFSTKNRVGYLKPRIEHRVWAYIGGVARVHKIVALQIGGVDDHIHALVKAQPNVSVSQVAQFLKGDSSRWIHQTYPELRGFAWQDGYGAFAVSKSNVNEVIHYIRNQREHHMRTDFKEEYSNLLRINGVKCDERYLLG